MSSDARTLSETNLTSLEEDLHNLDFRSPSFKKPVAFSNDVADLVEPGFCLFRQTDRTNSISDPSVQASEEADLEDDKETATSDKEEFVDDGEELAVDEEPTDDDGEAGDADFEVQSDYNDSDEGDDKEDTENTKGGYTSQDQRAIELPNGDIVPIKTWLEGLAPHIRALHAVQPWAIPPGLTEVPFPWQLSGAAKAYFLMFNSPFKGAIIGDAMGLGKTLLTLLVIDRVRNLPGGPALIICPATLIPQWEAQCETSFEPGRQLRAYVLRGVDVPSAEELLQFDVVIASYSYVETQHRKLADFERMGTDYRVGHHAMPKRPRTPLFCSLFRHLPFKMMVCDEAQAIKNHRGSQFTCIRKIGRASTLLLSGTFIANRWTDVFAFTRLLSNIPINSMNDFKAKFGSILKKKACGPGKIRARKLQQVLQCVTVARGAELLDLPGLRRERLEYEPTEQEREASDEFMKQYFRAMGIDHNDVSRTYDAVSNHDDGKLGLANKAVRMLCHPLMADAGWNNPNTRYHLLTNLWKNPAIAADSSRVRFFLRLFEEIGDEKALIFSESTDFLDILEIALSYKQTPCLRLDGRTPMNQRKGILAQFNSSGNTRPLLLTRGVGGVGLNAQSASVVFIMEVWWNRTWEEQADGRAFRIGQLKEVRSIRIRASGTLVDNHIAAVQQLKVKVNNRISAGLVRPDDKEPEIHFK